MHKQEIKSSKVFLETRSKTTQSYLRTAYQSRVRGDSEQ